MECWPLNLIYTQHHTSRLDRNQCHFKVLFIAVLHWTYSSAQLDAAGSSRRAILLDSQSHTWQQAASDPKKEKSNRQISKLSRIKRHSYLWRLWRKIDIDFWSNRIRWSWRNGKWRFNNRKNCVSSICLEIEFPVAIVLTSRFIVRLHWQYTPDQKNCSWSS